MSEKVIIEVEIDAEDAGKGLQKVEKSVEGIGKASKKTSKSVISIIFRCKRDICRQHCNIIKVQD